jgi:hypothetical protein
MFFGVFEDNIIIVYYSGSLLAVWTLLLIVAGDVRLHQALVFMVAVSRSYCVPRVCEEMDFAGGAIPFLSPAPLTK